MAELWVAVYKQANRLFRAQGTNECLRLFPRQQHAEPEIIQR